MAIARSGTLCLLMVCGMPGVMAAQGWTSLFDGVSLKGWKETQFTKHGTVQVKDGTIVLGTGYLTGITWTGDFPKSDYEIRFEAARLEGSDFFAALTFPVKDSFCT